MFKLEPNPTFRLKVGIPVPGQRPAQIELEFRHMGRSELKTFLETVQGRDDLDVVMDVVVGWNGVDAEFSRDNLGRLLDRYPASGLAIVGTYTKELSDARLGN